MMKRLTVFLMTAILSMTLIACSKQSTTQPSTEYSEIEASESGNATSGKEYGKSDGNDPVRSENPIESSTQATPTAKETTTAEEENAEPEPIETIPSSGETEATVVLYKKLCRHVYNIYPQMVGEHIALFRMQFEEKEE